MMCISIESKVSVVVVPMYVIIQFGDVFKGMHYEVYQHMIYLSIINEVKII